MNQNPRAFLDPSQHALQLPLSLRHLSPSINLCKLSNDTLKIHSSDADPECDSLDGVFPIKENCAMFYVCMKGKVRNQERGLKLGHRAIAPREQA